MILTEEEFDKIVKVCKEYIKLHKFPDLMHYDSDLARSRVSEGVSEAVSEAVSEGVSGAGALMHPQVDFDTFQCIFGQIYVRHMKKVTPEIDKDIASIAKQFEAGSSLVDIANSRQFSPYKLAKLFVKHILCYKDRFTLAKLLNNDIQDMSSIISGNKASHQTTDDSSSTRRLSNRLKAELIRCCLEDVFSSQDTDNAKNCAGREFEELLYNLMRQKNMCFETESELRLQGKPKTPDVLLMVPLALKLPCSPRQAAMRKLGKGVQDSSEATEYDVSIVHWIDSKAMFGDAATCQDQMEQLQGYVNRYGKGLVIYWHGYVESLPDFSDDIVFTDRFPDDWIFPV